MSDNTHQFEPYTYPFHRGLSDWIIFCLVSYLGFVFAWYIELNELTLVFIDQYSHLAIARQLTESITPGLSQLGFWPPLVHLLMAPFALIDPLFQSGLAAAFALVPVYALGAVFLYRTVLLLGGDRGMGSIAVAAYVLNPYLLYYAVTPMMETLFISLLMGVVYFTAHWWYTGKLASLLWLAGFVSLATLARFEGFFLLPIVGTLVLYRLWRRGTSYSEIEALAHLFGLIAVLGVAFIFTYGAIFGGSPLAFMESSWSAHEQQRDFARPAEYDATRSFTYLLHASNDMLSGILIGLAVLSFVTLLVFDKRRREIILALTALLLSPFLFDLIALYRGDIVIYLPHLPPYNIVFNERYGLYWIGAVLLLPPLAAAALYRAGARERRTWPVGFVLASVMGAVLLAGSFVHFYEVAACPACYTPVRESWLASKPWRSDLPRELAAEYDHGMILVTRAFFNETVVRAGIPLDRYIHESNEHYYEQAVDLPWLFARWVVMFNTQDESIPPWEQRNEKISNRWGGDEEFAYFYELVYQQETDSFYRLREDRVRNYVRNHGIAPSSVPSLSHEPLATWDVETTYRVFVERIKPEEIVSRQE